MMTSAEFDSYFCETLLRLDTLLNDKLTSKRLSAGVDIDVFSGALQSCLGDRTQFPFEFLNTYRYSPTEGSNEIRFIDKLSGHESKRRRHIHFYEKHDAALREYVISLRTLSRLDGLKELPCLQKRPAILTTCAIGSCGQSLDRFASVFQLPSSLGKLTMSAPDDSPTLECVKQSWNVLSKTCAYDEFVELNRSLKSLCNANMRKGGVLPQYTDALTSFLNYYPWTRLAYENVDTIVLISPTTIPNLTPFGVVAGFNVEKWTEDWVKKIKGVEVLATHGLSLWVEKEVVDKEKQVERHARRAAVAAIMGRNMSHNIGSHVLNYLSEKDGVGKFYGYLRDKMNFLTEIVTSEPGWGASMAFLPEVLAPYTTQTDLLGNIFRSELDDKDSPAIGKLKIIYKDSVNVPVTYTWANELNQDPKDVSRLEFPSAHIPHGVIGSHAFYSLMEGFIRNSAKHNKSKLNELNELSVTIRLDSDYDKDGYSKEYLRLRLSDNISKYRDCNLDIKPSECNCNEEDRKNCATNINRLLNEGLLNKEGAIVGSAWGLRELLMCAKWLRKIPASDERVIDPPVLKLKKEAGLDFWELYLLKPQNVLFVGECFKDLECLEKGIYVDNAMEVFESRLAEKKLAHTFVVIDGENSELKRWIDIHRNLLKLPQRLFIAGCKSSKSYAGIKKKDVPKDPGKIISCLYERMAMWVNNGKSVPNLAIAWHAMRLPSAQEERSRFEIISAGDGWQGSSGKICFSHAEVCSPKDDVRYMEGFSSSSAKTSLLGRLRSVENHSEVTYALCEAALLRVLIVDERLADVKKDMATDKEGSNLSFDEFWRRKNVYFATIVGDDVRVKGGYCGPFADFVREKIYAKEFHFISIHQTLITGLGDKWGETLAILQKFSRNVVVHSARGNVGIVSGFKFVDYSNLRNVLVDRPDKFALADRLMGLLGEAKSAGEV